MPTSTTTPLAIPANPVLPATRCLGTVSYDKQLRDLLGGKPLEAWSRDTKALVPTQKAGYIHGFIATLNQAYQEHYPVTLSPDHLWLLIAQGFALHLNQNAETLRPQFVAHEGQVELQVIRDTFVRGFAGNDWEGVFTEFSQKIREHIGATAHETLVPHFSTTGMVEQAAFEISLLDAMQAFFAYRVLTRCGIPHYFLEGTPDDWHHLREKAATLAVYGLDWWITPLLVVLDAFVAARDGKPEATFWESFYKWRNGSGGPHITGHVLAFFPYFQQPTPDTTTYIRNPFLSGERTYGGMTSEALRTGFSCAPFTWEYLGKEIPMEFLAGFVGATQDPQTLALRPEIGWAVREVKPRRSWF